MSSILTNTSAMVALQTLKGINSNLAQVQGEISTGKSISSAKDNAAVWAISKVIESDVAGFKGIQDSLSLGESAVSVARLAAERVTESLKEIKKNVIDAQVASPAARLKLQDSITDLTQVIEQAVGAAQVNGLNLVDNTDTVNFLSSLNRSASGAVTASTIDVTGIDLSASAYAAKGVLAGSDGVSANNDTAGFVLDNATGAGTLVLDDSTDAFAAGDSVSITIGNKTARYTVSAEDAAATTPSDIVAVGLKNAIDALGITGLTVDYDSGTAGTLAFSNTGTVDRQVSAQFKNAGSGGLAALSTIDVTSDAGATAALGNIETLIETSINAAAAFGSSEKQLEAQNDFVSRLSDALKTSIGSMVDADMEEASARLQALQVQQQLGVQSLSIANQAPQSILSLFR